MAKYRIRRELIGQAFEHAQLCEKAELIDLTPLTGMSIDAAGMILKKTEMLRDKYGHGGGKHLRGLVHQAAMTSGMPHERCYAYEVVLMNYYGIIKAFVAERRRAFAEKRKEREKESAPVE